MEKVAFASFAGTAIEFYAFYISRTAAAIVLGGVPPRALRDEDPVVRGSRQLQSRRGFRGTFAPLIAGGSRSISLYVLAMAAVSFVCNSLLSEIYLTDLAEIRAEERRPITDARESAAG